ncbi:MAG: PLP-dependent aspartate aminotransferase family protein [Thermomicrobiales bacterium]
MRAFATRCVHSGESPDPSTGAHGVPLYQNVTYAFDRYDDLLAMRAGDLTHLSYHPRGNPTVRALEAKVADLEGAESCIALNSGMAAISGAIMALVGRGGHLVASSQIYDLTREFVQEILPQFGCSVSLVDINDPDAIADAITPETRAIYAEPVSNPCLQMTDLAMVARVANAHDVPLAVDNTFLSPALLRPIELGATVVIHSATKYLSGNGQAQGGVVSGPAEVTEKVREQVQLWGTVMPAFSAWVILSGIHTLALRMERHSANALEVARYLQTRPEIESVIYPGLASHGDADQAGDAGMPSAFGGMITFTLRQPERTGAFIDLLQVCTLATSLGETSTLIWPWTYGGLIRISTGLEDAQDLIADFAQALDAIA